MLVDAVHGESLLPGVQAAAFFACSHRGEREREREQARVQGQTTPLFPHFFFFSLFKILIYFIIYLAVPGSLVVP